MILDLFLADDNKGIVFSAPAFRLIFGTWIYNRIFKKHPPETYFSTGAKVTTNFLTLLLTAQQCSCMGIVISLPLFLRERRVNFCESLETVYRVKFNATQLL